MFNHKPNNRSRAVLLIAILVTLTGYFAYKKIKQNFLNHQVKQLVKDKSRQLYTVDYDSIAVDELSGDAYVKNITIKGDTSLQKQLIAENDSNTAPVLFEMFIPELKVSRFKTASALLAKQLECQEILISRPNVIIYFYPGQNKPKNNRKTEEEIYKQILGKFSSIKAEKVSIIDSEVKGYDFFSREMKFKAVSTSVELERVKIDSASNQDTTRTLFCKKIGIKSDTIILGAKKNTAEITGASFDSESKIVALKSFCYDAIKNDGFFKSEVRGVTLEGLEWNGPMEASELMIDKVVIRNGSVDLLPGSGNQTKKQPSKILTGWIKRFSLNSLNVEDVLFRSINREKDKKPIIIRNNTFSLKHFKIDGSSQLDENLVNRAGEVEIHNKEITVVSDDRLYKYTLNGLSLNTKSKRITMKSFRMIPQLNEAAFTRKAKYRTDRYAVEIKNINCSNVNIDRLLKGELNIDRISTSGNTFKVFTDLSYSRDTSSKTGSSTFPPQILHSFSFPIRINKIVCSETYIEYKEKNNISRKSGRVRFSRSELIIQNVSNSKSSPREELTMAFKTTFLDQIPVTGRFSFLLSQWKKGTFSVTASVSKSFDATIVNELTEPMALLKIEKGSIHLLKFEMRADSNTSKGSLILPYNDLKISLLGKDGNGYRKKGIFSFFTNIIVRNNNKEGSGMRSAQASVNRKKERSFFNFIWLTLFTNVREIALVKI